MFAKNEVGIELIKTVLAELGVKIKWKCWSEYGEEKNLEEDFFLIFEIFKQS